MGVRGVLAHQRDEALVRRLLRTSPRAERARAQAVQAALDAGRQPAPEAVEATVRFWTGVADAAAGRGAVAAAAVPLARAAAVAFHRTTHFDGATSPLVDAPDQTLAALRASSAWTLATRPRPAPRPRPPRAVSDGRHRLLIVSLRNWKFLEAVVRRYEERGDVDVRRLDLADLPGLPLSPVQQLRLRLAGPDDARTLPWARRLADAVDAADTVFVDWLQRGAVLVSALAPGPARLVVRLHSFEAFTVFPHLVDHARLDDLVVVGPHLGRLLDRLVPAAALPRRHVLPNFADLRRFGAAGPKPADARFTLAVVGYGVVAKDPLWAVEVLARLRACDPRYRLLLVGDDLDPAGPAGAAGYRLRLERRIGERDVAGAVERVAFTPDVPSLLRRTGVVVSSSVRESFHLALVEGAASGAVPVVRDWPLFAGDGPAGLFPPDWVCRDAAAAARRIRALTADEATWRAAGAAAARWVLDRYDAAVTGPRYDGLLLEG